MRKIFLSVGIAGMMFSVSCNSINKMNVDDAKTTKFKGDWEITSINYEKGYKVKPFDEGADSQCFIGSHWRLIPNNYSGAYTLKGGGSCPVKTQAIKFEITKDNEFKFKKIEAVVKAKNITSGYILQVEKQDVDHFTLVQDVPFEGKILKVYYSFARTGMLQ